MSLLATLPTGKLDTVGLIVCDLCVFMKLNTNEWKILVQQRKQQKFSIPRRIPTTNLTTLLHVFADASKLEYAAVAYVTDNDNANLILAKTRLNPTKEMTIPRLELMGVLIATRLTKYLKKELSFLENKSFIWTYSTCVLSWLNSNKDLPRFISNRIKEIKDTKNIQFKYVPTKDNPAYIASRGTSPEELKLNILWWKGPTWITHEEKWLLQPPLKETEGRDDT